MVSYLTEYSLIHPNHHARDGEMAGVCFLDMSAAFDIVDHSLLLSKLELYGFDSGMLAWVSSYLSNRYQCVSIDGTLSKLQYVQHGVRH